MFPLCKNFGIIAAIILYSAFDWIMMRPGKSGHEILNYGESKYESKSVTLGEYLIENEFNFPPQIRLTLLLKLTRQTNGLHFSSS
jgi:hypothetical protein